VHTKPCHRLLRIASTLRHMKGAKNTPKTLFVDARTPQCLPIPAQRLKKQTTRALESPSGGHYRHSRVELEVRLAEQLSVRILALKTYINPMVAEHL